MFDLPYDVGTPGDPALVDPVQTLLPPSVADARGRAIEQLLQRATSLDLEGLLVRRLAGVPDSALAAIAWERGVLDTPAWLRAADVLARRAVLAEAFQRHRAAGTPWAVRRALLDLGWTTATVDDAPQARKYDGSWVYDGNTQLGVRSWWGFAVHVGTLAAAAAFGPDDATAIQAAVDAWRPARSRLTEIGVTLAPITQALPTLPDVADVTRVGIGSGTGAGLVPLTNAFVRRAVSSQAVGDSIVVAFRFRGRDVPGLVIREIALLDDASTILARVVRPAAITRLVATATQAGVAIEGTFTLTPA